MSWTCDNYQIAFVNGIKCHEPNCLDAWQDYLKDCAWGGSEFQAEHPEQTFCDVECQESYCN